MKNFRITLSFFLAFAFVANASANINIYTPNAPGGPTNALIKNAVLPAIPKIKNLEISNYTATLNMQQIINETKTSLNSLIIMTDSNVAMYEKITNKKITDDYNINGIIAITPVVLFKSANSRLDWSTLINKNIRLAFVEGDSSERCAKMMQTEYEGNFELIKISSQAEMFNQLLKDNIDGFCTAALSLSSAYISASRIVPVAISSGVTFPPFSKVKPFPDNKVISARGFIGVFSSKRNVEAENLAKKLIELIKNDSYAISEFNKLMLEPIGINK